MVRHSHDSLGVGVVRHSHDSIGVGAGDLFKVGVNSGKH